MRRILMKRHFQQLVYTKSKWYFLTKLKPKGFDEAPQGNET